MLRDGLPNKNMLVANMCNGLKNTQNVVQDNTKDLNIDSLFLLHDDTKLTPEFINLNVKNILKDHDFVLDENKLPEDLVKSIYNGIKHRECIYANWDGDTDKSSKVNVLTTKVDNMCKCDGKLYNDVEVIISKSGILLNLHENINNNASDLILLDNYKFFEFSLIDDKFVLNRVSFKNNYVVEIDFIRDNEEFQGVKERWKANGHDVPMGTRVSCISNGKMFYGKVEWMEKSNKFNRILRNPYKRQCVYKIDGEEISEIDFIKTIKDLGREGMEFWRKLTLEDEIFLDKIYDSLDHNNNHEVLYYKYYNNSNENI